MPSQADKVMALLYDGFTIGQRDRRLNRNYAGNFMVVEAYTEDQLPTKDGRNGPWCVVGDDLEVLVDNAFDFLTSTKEEENG